jgi:hypothetical protein
MTGSPGASDGLLAQAQKAGQEHAHNHHAEKTQGPPGLLQQSHAAGQERGEEQQVAGKLPNESWIDFIARIRQPGQSSGGNEGAAGDDKDGYERGQQRSLPDEEKDKTRGR